jgi:hypothetical protein
LTRITTSWVPSAAASAIADNPEHAAAVGNLDAQAQFDLAQMCIQWAGEIGQSRHIIGLKGEVALGQVGHRH